MMCVPVNYIPNLLLKQISFLIPPSKKNFENSPVM